MKYGEMEIKRTAKMGEILDQGIKYSREVVHNLLRGICKHCCCTDTNNETKYSVNIGILV